MGGMPWLVSFSGIAEVLGWPSRLPLVAPEDRRRVLESWTPLCGGHRPQECSIPFAQVHDREANGCAGVCIQRERACTQLAVKPSLSHQPPTN